MATTSASAQRFIEAAGSHVLKAGVEVEYAATNEDDGFPAGEQFSDLDGQPVQVVTWDGYLEHTTNWRTSAYIRIAGAWDGCRSSRAFVSP